MFQNVITTSNIVYGSNTSSNGSVTSLTLDVYEPDGDTMTKRPLIIWVHGGSFVGGSKSDPDVTALCQRFAKRGYVCASIEYRLGFSVFPPTKAAAEQAVYMAVQDMKAAVRFFRKDEATVDSFQIDSQMIFGGGSSAGAFTALHLAYLDEPSEIPVDIDTTMLGGMEGESGNPGFPSNINAVINLCGALGDKTFIQDGDIPFCSMHGNLDGTVPYATAIIYLLGVFPVMSVDGSYSVSEYADSIGVPNNMYTFFGADHVPYLSNLSYMDTTVRYVSNFLYRYFGCTPSDPFPEDNTFPTNTASVISDNSISVYPNPGKGIFNFSFQESVKDRQISVFDFSGRKILLVDLYGNSGSVDLKNFSSGIYFFQLSNGEKMFSGKLIKE